MNYEDILYLPHPISKKHTPMKLEKRSAQFAPFAALVGYEEMVIDTARIVDDEKIKADDSKLRLDYQLNILAEYIKHKPEIIFTCFKRDNKKSGGKYIQIRGKVNKLNLQEKQIILMNGRNIKISEIVDMAGKIFEQL